MQPPFSTCSGRIALSAGIGIFLCGCVTYVAQPLSSETSATALAERRLGGGVWTRARLTATALQQQPELEVARAKVATAQAAIVTAGARPNPTAGFSATNTARLLDGVEPWTMGFTLDVPIETAGKRGQRLAQARALANAAALNLSHAEWLTKSRVRKSLFDVFAAKQRQDLLGRQQTNQDEIVKLLDARIAEGEVSRLETMQARLQASQSRLLIRDAERLSAEARASLAEAVGVSVHALEAVQLSFAGLEALPRRPDEARLRRAALLQRSDLLAALAEYAAAEAAVRLEIAKQYPDLHLGPGYAYDQGQNKWTIGFSATIPLLDQNRGPIAEALARRREAAANFAALQAKALAELERALAGFRGSLAKLETADQLLAAQEKQQRSSEAIFKAGESDRLTLASAQVELHSARLSRLDSQLEALKAVAQVEDAAQLTLTSP